MRKLLISLSLPAGLLLAVAAPSLFAQAPEQHPVIDRELYVEVDVEADQKWESRTEEFGYQHSTAKTTQRYVLQTRLRSDSGLHSRNVLNPSMDERLQAKTIHLARQAVRDIRAEGGEFEIPTTPEGRQELTRQMQIATHACGGDANCRQQTMLRYAAIFAVMDNPSVLDDSADGDSRYRYYEPYPGCESYSYVRMNLEIEGIRWSKSKDELVPFAEKRSANKVNPKHDVPLCNRYLATMDTQDAEKPFYLENFYVPSAVGETAYTIYGRTNVREEEQPMPPAVLEFVTETLKHAEKSGAVETEFRLTYPLNGVSEETGTAIGTAKVKLKWDFRKPQPFPGG